MEKTKEPPKPLPCKCGDIAVTLRPRGGRWAVYCLNPACDRHVRNFTTETAAVGAWNAWNKEAAKK